MFGLKCMLQIRPTAPLWDLASGLLYQFHSQGIEEAEVAAPEGDASMVAANEFELALEPGILAPPEHFTAYFDNRRDAERALRAIEPVLAGCKPTFEIFDVPEVNYAELWKEGFQPILCPPHWLIRAPWHDSSKEAGKTLKELIIEPGMAFGTGSHETTKGCLELLSLADAQSPFSAKTRLLDFGCGSGILAIAMKQLGAGSVVGVDIDPLAITATQQNAERNSVKVEARLQLIEESGLDGIAANILKNTLLDFAKPFHDWLRPGGFLVLSGLLSEQEDAIMDVYLKLGFKNERKISANNWISLLLKKE